MLLTLNVLATRDDAFNATRLGVDCEEVAVGLVQTLVGIFKVLINREEFIRCNHRVIRCDFF